MKKLIPLFVTAVLLSACAPNHHPDMPATPADIPPPTDLLSSQQTPSK